MRHGVAVVLLLGGWVAAAQAPAGSLSPRPLDAELWSETWTLLFLGDDGTTARIEQAVSNLGPGDGNGACRVVIVAPRQPGWTEKLVTGAEQVASSTGPPAALDVGPCGIRADGAVSAWARQGGRGARLSLQAPVRPVEPPHGRLDLGRDGVFDEQVLIPWAPATLVVEQADGGERTVVGRASFDRYRVTLLPDDLAEVWLRFRGLGDGPPLLIEARDTPRSRPDEAWVWRAGALGPLPATGLTATLLEDGWRVSLHTDHQRITLQTQAALTRYAPIEGHGVFSLLARALVGNPVTRTWRATAEDGGATTQGLLEVMRLE